MQLAAPGSSHSVIPLHRTPHAPPLSIVHSPLLLDAREGDLFYLDGDDECLFALLATPALVADGERRWCVAIASNDALRPAGMLCSAPITTPVTPVAVVRDMRVQADSQKWAGR